jgi:hypothetical protein
MWAQIVLNRKRSHFYLPLGNQTQDSVASEINSLKPLTWQNSVKFSKSIFSFPLKESKHKIVLE